MRVPSPGQIPGSVLEPFQKPSDQARNFIALRIHGLFLYSETEGQGKTLKNGEVSWPTARFVVLKTRWFSNLPLARLFCRLNLAVQIQRLGLHESH